MSMNITVKNGIYRYLKELKPEGKSFSDAIEAQVIKIKILEETLASLQEANINQEGRFEGSKTISGKTILYKIKE